MEAFLHMGGYAAYVWPAYAVFFVVLLIDFFAPYLRRRRVLRELHARMQRQKAREARKAAQRSPSDDSGPTMTPLDS
jgi:heme exporter protein D